MRRIPYVVPNSAKHLGPEVDLCRFARDLCATLGGRDLTHERYDSHFLLGNDMIHLRTDRQYKRVSLSISAPDVDHKDRAYDYGGHKTPDISVNPDGRTIEQIAADVKRRLIVPAQHPLANQRRHRDERAETRTAVKAAADRLSDPTNRLHVTLTDEGQRGNISGNGHYLSGRFTSNSVSLERIGTMSIDQFIRVLAILNEEDAN